MRLKTGILETIWLDGFYRQTIGGKDKNGKTHFRIWQSPGNFVFFPNTAQFNVRLPTKKSLQWPDPSKTFFPNTPINKQSDQTMDQRPYRPKFNCRVCLPFGKRRSFCACQCRHSNVLGALSVRRGRVNYVRFFSHKPIFDWPCRLPSIDWIFTFLSSKKTRFCERRKSYVITARWGTWKLAPRPNRLCGGIPTRPPRIILALGFAHKFRVEKRLRSSSIGIFLEFGILAMRLLENFGFGERERE